MNMYYSTMPIKDNGLLLWKTFVGYACEIGHDLLKKMGSVWGKSVYYSTASRPVLPLMCNYTIGLGQRGLAGLLIWASRLGF
jgi:hypothetical protein